MFLARTSLCASPAGSRRRSVSATLSFSGSAVRYDGERCGMGPVVRAASLRGLPALVDGLGGDSTALLARFGVTREAVASDDAVIAVRSAGLLLETAAAELG